MLCRLTYLTTMALWWMLLVAIGASLIIIAPLVRLDSVCTRKVRQLILEYEESLQEPYIKD